MDRKLLHILKKFGLGHDSKPPTAELWPIFIKSIEDIFDEAKERVHLTENTLAVSTAELEDLYAKLRYSTNIERDQSNQALLLKSEENQKLLSLMNSVLESSTEGILVVDHLSRRIQHYNNAFASLWSIPKDILDRRNDEEVLGFVLSQLKNPQSFIDLVISLNNSPEQESFDEIEFSDGKLFERTSVPLRVNGEIKGRVWFFKDQTKTRQQMLQIDMHKIQLAQASRLSSLGEISAGIAHEINNPLAIIAGNALTLKKFRTDPDKFDSKIETIQRSVIRISKIVSGLRKFSRTSEKSEFKKHNLKGIIDESIAMASAIARKEGVVIEFECSVDPVILCDEIEIEQVVVNLISNAVDAIKELQEKWIKVVLLTEGNETVLQIWDSGSGISEEIRSKIFQPFFTTKPVGQGTGLGLAIVTGIINEHHAKISILDNVPNTCFQIRFTIADVGSAAA
jgi:signal transduction histidine kinase